MSLARERVQTAASVVVPSRKGSTAINAVAAAATSSGGGGGGSGSGGRAAGSSSSASFSSEFLPNLPFIVAHSYMGEWKSAKRITAARLRLAPRTIINSDKTGPHSYHIEKCYERLSTARGQEIGGSGRGSGFGHTPRMSDVHDFNERARSAGHRPTSAGSRTRSPRDGGPRLDYCMVGTSLPGGMYMRVDATPGADAYDVRRSTPLVTRSAPRCSFGTAARFDAGAEASQLCRAKPVAGRNRVAAAAAAGNQRQPAADGL